MSRLERCILLLIVAIVIIALYGAFHKGKPRSNEQILKIERLSKLKAPDMVLGKDGIIYMVSLLDNRGEHGDKAGWRLTLQGFGHFDSGNQGTGAFDSTFPLNNVVRGISGGGLVNHGNDNFITRSLQDWGDFIEETIYQDDPKWTQAAKCYLQVIECKALLK